MADQIYDEQLQLAQEKIDELKYAEKTMISFRRQRKLLESKILEAKLKLEKENRDVEIITGVSFQSFIATLFNNRQDKIEKEELEAIEAKRSYDAIVYELDVLKDDIEKCESVILHKMTYEKAYEAAFEAKKNYIMSQNVDLWDKIQNMELKKLSLNSEIKELKEAVLASDGVLKASSNALSELRDAKNLGVWDTLGGGMLVTMAKRDHMSKAQSSINAMNSRLKRFNQELADVNMYLTEQIDIGNYMSFADYFFDSFFMDIMVQNKIQGALEKVEQLDIQVKTIKRKLKMTLVKANVEQEKLVEAMNQLIIVE